MCFNYKVSLLTFLIGLVGSFVLLRYGNPLYKIENITFGIAFILIVSMQFLEFIFWIDLSNTLGLNYLASLIGPLLNVGQPLILYLVKLLLNLCTIKSPTLSAFIGIKGNSYHALDKCEGVDKGTSPYGNIVAILNGLYFLYMIKMYTQFVSSGDILTTVKHGHLSWKWLKYTNPIFYLLLLAINIFYLSNFTYASVMFSITYFSLYLSNKYFSYNAGELWCFFGAFIPLFIFGASYYI